MAHTETTSTKVQYIVDCLHELVVSGATPPGARLAPAAIGKQFDVSAAVVREALSRLSASGLVQVEPNSGFRVAPVSNREYKEINAARLLIEEAGLRSGIGRGDLEWEARMLAANHVLGQTSFSDSSSTPSVAWAAAHRRFHDAIVSGSDNRVLSALYATLWDRSDRYRSLLASPSWEGAATSVHQEITAAILAKDVARAMDLLAEHLHAQPEFAVDLVEGAVRT